MKATTYRRGFSLVELLVVITLIVMLIAMMATALNAARASGAKQKTKASIAMLSEIIQRHFRSTESMSMPSGVTAAERGAAIRRQITADMPDSWADVQRMQNPPPEDLVDGESPYTSARQRGYITTLAAIAPTSQYGDAECLFMIVMQGGLADCIECSGLGSIAVGDKDSDKAPEFLDAWGEPIEYVLWPAGFELPLGEKFFDQTVAPFEGAGTVAEGGTMRPLIVSGGPDKTTGIAVNGGSYLSLQDYCGHPSPVPANADINGLGGPLGDESRSDNITNFDDEVKR